MLDICVVAYLVHSERSVAAREEASRIQLVSHVLFHGFGLAGEEALVHLHAAFRQYHVRGHLVAGLEKYHVVQDYVSRVDLRSLAVSDHVDIARREERKPVHRALGSYLLDYPYDDVEGRDEKNHVVRDALHVSEYQSDPR